MSQELVRRDQDAFELGRVFAESKMFPNTTKAAEAVVKIIAGREFGLGPMAAMNGIHMVDGKPTLAANLIAGQIKRHPRYDYKVERREADGCTLRFFEDGQFVGKMTWTKADAQAAGLLGKTNWKRYPRDMFFARCLTAGARTYCPDVLGGSPIYTAEELGADESTPVTPQEPVSAPPTPDIGQRYADAVAEVTDAEVVADEPRQDRISEGVYNELRALLNEKGVKPDELAWIMLSVGIDLPENPDKSAVLDVLRNLNIEQAARLDSALKGEDDSIPGSGEAA